MSDPDTPGMKKCPWCAEEILVEAKKCKHCGEYLSDERPTPVVDQASNPPLDEELCAYSECQLSAVPDSCYCPTHKQQVAAMPRPGLRPEAVTPVRRYGTWGWPCIRHGKANCAACRQAKSKNEESSSGCLPFLVLVLGAVALYWAWPVVCMLGVAAGFAISRRTDDLQPRTHRIAVGGLVLLAALAVVGQVWWLTVLSGREGGSGGTWEQQDRRFERCLDENFVLSVDEQWDYCGHLDPGPRTPFND